VRSWAAAAAGQRSTAYLPRLPLVPGNEATPSLCVWIDDDVVVAVLRPVPIPRDLPSPLRSKANLSPNPFLLGSAGSLVVHVEDSNLGGQHTARLCVPEDISRLRSRQRRVDRKRREALDRLVDLKGTKYYGFQPLTHSWLPLLPLEFPAGLSLSFRALGLGATCVQEALGSSAGSGRWFTRTACMPNHLLPSSRRG
jgi:hypothetical protein